MIVSCIMVLLWGDYITDIGMPLKTWVCEGRRQKGWWEEMGKNKPLDKKKVAHLVAACIRLMHESAITPP